MSKQPRRILLVACPGGHLLQMLALHSAWEDLEHLWVTLESPDSTDLLNPGERIFAYGPTSRNAANLLRNLLLAWRLVRNWRPDVILSTGAGLAVPFFIVGRPLGARLIYVESFTRVRQPALTGRLVYPLAHAFFVQWPGCTRRTRAIYAGSLV